jgi:serine O-acetyltransferase
MIKSKQDYRSYLHWDAKARGINLNTISKRLYHSSFDELWRFQKLLRLYELYRNKKKNIFISVVYQIIRFRYKKMSIHLGFSIPPNVLGPGCYLPHYGTIIINGNAKIGQNCLIHAGVVIGANGGSDKAPIIGDNVFIGPGAKIYGDITIEDNVYIAANSVVNKSIAIKNSIFGGMPAKFIGNADKLWWEKNRLTLEVNKY